MRTTSLFFVLILAGCPGGPATLPTDPGDPNDRDGDGFNQAQDCDDNDELIHPDAEDTVGDNVDNDCDGVDGVDDDGDTHASLASGGEDCNDADNQINPDALDVGWNEIDEDCSGSDRHDYTTIGVGNSVTCGVKSTGELVCWGDDSQGQISQVPATTGTWSAVTGGDGWMCGIQDGVIECWGDDHWGIISNVPPITDVVGSDSWQQITAGRDHACAITNLNGLLCWGRDDFLQTSGPNLLVGLEVLQVAPGKDHTCLLFSTGASAGRPQCYGSDSFDQQTPRPLGGVFLQISSGDDHTCGVLDDQTLSCWGSDTNGQDNPINRTGPYTDLSLSSNSSCGILSSTDITCWGQGNFNQIFPPDRTAVQVELGPSHGCARNGVGLVYCWGDNALNQGDVP